jgi:hypothetical protein
MCWGVVCADLVYANTTHGIDARTVFAACDDTSIILDAAQAAGIAVGDVIVGTLNGYFLDGNITSCTLITRKIVSITTLGSLVRWDTLPAVLDDIFDSYNINIPDITAAPLVPRTTAGMITQLHASYSGYLQCSACV